MTAYLPAGISVGPVSKVAPSSVELATQASVSSIPKYTSQKGGVPFGIRAGISVIPPIGKAPRFHSVYFIPASSVVSASHPKTSP